jgi:hypothetical protein
MDKAYDKGVRDTVIAIAWGIVKKFVEPGVDKGDVYLNIYGAVWEEDKRNKIIECIVSDGTNEDRSRCIMGVLGIKIV